MAIPAALRARACGFVSEADGRSTLLVPVVGRNGHELGLIGLTLAVGSARPDAASVARTVASRLSVSSPGLAGEAA